MEKDQKLFLTHIFLRDFFDALLLFSYAYLLLYGFPLQYILFGLAFFRFFESFVCVPISRRILNKENLRIMFLLSLVLQGIYLFLILLSKDNPLFFAVAIFVMCIWDAIYWPIRTGLERITPHATQTSKGVGFSQGTAVFARTLGLILTPFLLLENGFIAALFATIGYIMSYIPIHFITEYKNIEFKSGKSFFSLFKSAEGGFFKFMLNPLIVVLGLLAITNEIIRMYFPLILTEYDIKLVEVGFLFAAINVITFLLTSISGHIEDIGRNKFFYILSIIVLLVILVFLFLPFSYLSLFFILFGVTSTPLGAFIWAKSQRYMGKKFIGVDTGYCLEFVDMFTKGLSYPVFFMLFLLNLSNFIQIALLMSFLCVLGALVVFYRYKL